MRGVDMINLLIAFSGGRTSAYMTKWLTENKQNNFDNIEIVFANTGQEYEETLEFVNRCDKEFNLGVVWVEASVSVKHGKGTGFKIVDFVTASRNGEPYENVIKKFGIPNQSHPICTRELKLRPIQSYLKSKGWKKKDYVTALGIRCDEAHRISSRCEEDRIIYPLIEYHPMDKPTINWWWKQQDFDLNLPEHKGNCSWCWKKSKRKLLTLAKEDQGIFEFPNRMEQYYGRVGAEFRKENASDRNNRVFFRGNQSTIELLYEATQPFTAFTDKNYDYNAYMDDPNGCTESCEIFPTK